MLSISTIIRAFIPPCGSGNASRGPGLFGQEDMMSKLGKQITTTLQVGHVAMLSIEVILCYSQRSACLEIASDMSYPLIVAPSTGSGECLRPARSPDDDHGGSGAEVKDQGKRLPIDWSCCRKAPGGEGGVGRLPSLTAHQSALPGTFR